MNRKSSDNIRVFSGFAFNAPARSTLYSALEPVRSEIPEFRWIPPERWHVTVQFYGVISWNTALELAEALASFQEYRPRVQLQEIDAFPSMDDPRVLWVGIRPVSSVFCNLVQQIHALGQAMNCPPEERAYRPHITIGRRRSESEKTVTMPKIWSAEPYETRLEPVTLFRSDWTQNEPHYTPIQPSKCTK